MPCLPFLRGRMPPSAERFTVVPWGRLAMLPALCLALVLSGCTGLFLHPDQVHYLPDRTLGTPAQDVWIDTLDGSRLHALLLPAQGRPRASLLFLHGNAENLSSHVHAVTWLPARGYEVLALDYRGFGRSQGEASVDAIHEDARAALDWLTARYTNLSNLADSTDSADARDDGDGGGDTARDMPLVVYGQSLGASVAIRLVAQQAQARTRVAAVIADSPFASYRGIAREKLGQVWLTWPLQWPLSLLISDRHAAIDVVGRISPVPLLLIHGERDRVVPAEHSRRLFTAAGEPKDLWLIPEGGHIDAVRRESLRTRLLAFLDRVSASQPGDAVGSVLPE